MEKFCIFRRYDTIQYIDIKNNISIFSISRVITRCKWL